MIATVTLNPSLDKTLTVDALIADDTNRAVAVRLDPGGKGINVSRVVREFGGQTLAMGLLGGHNGELVRHALDDEGIATDFNWIDGETRENLILEDKHTGHQYRINAPGPFVRVEEGDRLKRKLSGWEKRPDFVVFSGSIPPGLAKDVYRDLIQDAHIKGLRTALDADGTALRAGVAARPTVVKPNRYELERFVGHELGSEEALIAAGQELIRQGVELVILSDGPRSAYAISADEVWVAIPPEIDAQSAVGAGDSMLGGVIWRLCSGASLDEALAWGVAAGAATAMTPGTELCHLKDVKLLHERVGLRRLAAVGTSRV